MVTPVSDTLNYAEELYGTGYKLNQACVTMT